MLFLDAEKQQMSNLYSGVTHPWVEKRSYPLESRTITQPRWLICRGLMFIFILVVHSTRISYQMMFMSF